MSTILAPAGLVALNAPIPSPPQFDLLAAATLITPESDRWLGGGWSGGFPPGPAHTHDPCSTGTDRAKIGAGPNATQMSGRFTVYLPGFCTAQSIGPDPTWWTDRLEMAFKVYEGAAVERVLATGDGHATLGNYLGDGNMEVLGTGVSALRGFELLEQAIARHGTGIIHAAPATVAAWDSINLTENVRGIKRSKTSGNPIASGYGYVGVQPDGQGAVPADSQWAFASGPIEIYRSIDILTVPGSYAQALDRAVNDVVFIAERPYLINWIARQDSSDDDHVQAGVLIDLVP